MNNYRPKAEEKRIISYNATMPAMSLKSRLLLRRFGKRPIFVIQMRQRGEKKSAIIIIVVGVDVQKSRARAASHIVRILRQRSARERFDSEEKGTRGENNCFFVTCSLARPYERKKHLSVQYVS